MKLQVVKHPHVHSMAHALALQPVMPRSPSWHHRRDMWLAVAVTVGLFGTLLSMDGQTKRPSDGRILAASKTVPLEVMVRIQLGQTSWTTTAQPIHGTIPEVLASIAEQTHTSLMYDAPGSSIYLSQFLGRGAEPGSRWRIVVNGIEVTDLGQVWLAQGDSILITRS